MNENVAEPFGISVPTTANYTLSSAPAFATQKSAPPELRVISQPPGEIDITHYENYVYRKSSSPSYIYHAELGIEPRHLDVWGRPIEWVFTRRTIYLNQNTISENPRAKGHSTCTASKAAGTIYGASKSARLVIVKMSDFRRASVAGILGTIFDHIVNHGRQGKSVVNISWGTSKPMTGPLPHEWEIFLDSCRDLESISVPIFIAASNFALEPDHYRASTRREIDTVPALFYKRLSNIYTIGNCDIHGHRNAKSQDDTTNYMDQIHAPGMDVACPVPGHYSGASFGKFLDLCPRFHASTSSWLTDPETRSTAAPLVAGVVADFLGDRAMSNLDLRSLIFEHASWRRQEGEKRVIWNMVDAAHNPPLRFAPDIRLSNITVVMDNATAIS